MSRLRPLAIIIAVALLSTVSVQPQQSTIRHLAKDGIDFDYPADWKLTESTANDAQAATVASADGTAQIIVGTSSISSCDFETEAKKIMAALVQRTAQQIHSASPTRAAPATTQVAAAAVAGVRLRGEAQGKVVTADVYSFRKHLLFINLVYVRVENDQAAAAAWHTVRTTLKIEPGARSMMGTADSADGSNKPASDDVLNGKAIRLPVPIYPPIARQAHAGGTVSIQVIIDESGAVISAKPFSGHPLLQASSLQAAREAQFSPTKLCGEPVRVIGVIVYQFVPR
jgi:TonB family protein